VSWLVGAVGLCIWLARAVYVSGRADSAARCSDARKTDVTKDDVDIANIFSEVGLVGSGACVCLPLISSATNHVTAPIILQPA